MVLSVALVLVSAGCPARVETVPAADSDYVRCVEVITAAYAAFNAFDLEKCLSYLEPSYAVEARPALQENMQQFLKGRAMGVRLVPAVGPSPLSQSADSLSLCVTMSVRPGRLHPDEHFIYELKKISGEWKISAQKDDPDWRSRTPLSS